MDKKESTIIVAYAKLSKLLKTDPKNAIKYIEQNRNLFNFTDEYLENLKAKYN